VHHIIRVQLGNIDKSLLYFRKLSGYDIEEVRNLHDEWFPIKYQDNFFRRIYKENVIAIGCFYPIYKDCIGVDGTKKRKKKEVIVGCILTKVERDNEEIDECYRAKSLA